MRWFHCSGLSAMENTPWSSSIRTSKVLAKIIIKLTLLNLVRPTRRQYPPKVLSLHSELEGIKISQENGYKLGI